MIAHHLKITVKSAEERKNSYYTGNYRKVHDIVLNVKRLKVSEIAKAVLISQERVRNILHKELDKRKLCAKWVLHLLNGDQK